jgi:hypothetical protein
VPNSDGEKPMTDAQRDACITPRWPPASSSAQRARALHGVSTGDARRREIPTPSDVNRS